MKSAEARLQDMGMFQPTAMRRSAFTSGSWESDSRGSQKKIRKSMQPSAMRAGELNNSRFILEEPDLFILRRNGEIRFSDAYIRELGFNTSSLHPLERPAF
jgi:hypothetical protein